MDEEPKPVQDPISPCSFSYQGIQTGNPTRTSNPKEQAMNPSVDAENENGGDKTMCGFGDGCNFQGPYQFYGVGESTIGIGFEPQGPVQFVNGCSFGGLSEGLYQVQQGNIVNVDLPRVTPTDRRYKRKIKNRESAARSRARRQAHLAQLEFEVRKLGEENNLLKEKVDALYLMIASHWQPQRTLPEKKLQTTSSTAF